MASKIPPEEIKKVRKTLLLNLVVGDLVILLGLLINWQGIHQWEVPSILLIVLGCIWVVMTVSKMIKFRRFLATNKHE